MNSLYPWMIFAKFVWNWPCGLKNPQLFFTIISPWKRAWPYIWTVTRECFMLSVVEIGPKFFFYCRQRIFSNLLDLPFEKKALNIDLFKTETPLRNVGYCQGFLSSMHYAIRLRRWRSGSDHWLCKRKVGYSIPSRDILKALKQKVTAPLLNREGLQMLIYTRHWWPKARQ